MPEIDHHSETPVYRQIAAILRADIESGARRPRRPLPSEQHMVQEFGVARDTIRRALAYLAALGLVRTVPGRGTFVRSREVVQVTAEPDMRVLARRPTEAERSTMDLDEGEWVLMVERGDGTVEVFPADQVEVRIL